MLPDSLPSRRHNRSGRAQLGVNTAPPGCTVVPYPVCPGHPIFVSHMKAPVVAQALATVDEIRALLQAAQFAVRKFEQLASQGPLDKLSDQIHSVKVAADRVRAQLLRR